MPLENPVLFGFCVILMGKGRAASTDPHGFVASQQDTWQVRNGEEEGEEAKEERLLGLAARGGKAAKSPLWAGPGRGPAAAASAVLSRPVLSHLTRCFIQPRHLQRSFVKISREALPRALLQSRYTMAVAPLIYQGHQFIIQICQAGQA